MTEVSGIDPGKLGIAPQNPGINLRNPGINLQNPGINLRNPGIDPCYNSPTAFPKLTVTARIVPDAKSAET